MRPWPPSLPREAGRAGVGRARAGGGGYLFVRQLPTRRLLPSFLPAGRHRVALTACSYVYEQESARTLLCQYRKTRCYSWRSLCAHAPLGAPAAIVVSLPTATHTPFLREEVDLKNLPIQPTPSSSVARLGRSGRRGAVLSPPSSEFLGHGVCLWTPDTQDAPGPAMPAHSGLGTGVCALLPGPPCPPHSWVFLASPRHQGSRAYPGLTRL